MIAPLLALLVACAPQPAEELPPPDPEAGLEEVRLALDEALRLDKEGRTEDARTAWRRAHAHFESDIEPVLAASLPPREVTALEYRMGWIRTQLDLSRGKPEPAVEALLAELEEQIGRAR